MLVSDLEITWDNKIGGIYQIKNIINKSIESEFEMEEYYQTFSDKHGFMKDLSILDLLCNKGPESLTYIKNININL